MSHRYGKFPEEKLFLYSLKNHFILFFLVLLVQPSISISKDDDSITIRENQRDETNRLCK